MVENAYRLCAMIVCRRRRFLSHDEPLSRHNRSSERFVVILVGVVAVVAVDELTRGCTSQQEGLNRRKQ